MEANLDLPILRNHLRLCSFMSTRRQLAVWTDYTCEWTMWRSFMRQQRAIRALALKKPKREVSALSRPWLEPGFLTCLVADRCLCLAPVDRKVAGHKTWAIFCCAESRWWHGAADGYGKESGLKPGLTHVKQKVFTTQERPEMEADVTLGLTEVGKWLWSLGRDLLLFVGSFSVKLWNVVGEQWMLSAAQSQWRHQAASAAWIWAHQRARQQFAQVRNTKPRPSRANRQKQSSRGGHSG